MVGYKGWAKLCIQDLGEWQVIQFKVAGLACRIPVLLYAD